MLLSKEGITAAGQAKAAVGATKMLFVFEHVYEIRIQVHVCELFKMRTEKALSKYASIFKHKLGIQARLRGKLSVILSKALLLKEEAHDQLIVTW